MKKFKVSIFEFYMGNPIIFNILAVNEAEATLKAIYKLYKQLHNKRAMKQALHFENNYFLTDMVYSSDEDTARDAADILYGKSTQDDILWGYNDCALMIEQILVERVTKWEKVK